MRYEIECPEADAMHCPECGSCRYEPIVNVGSDVVTAEDRYLGGMGCRNTACKLNGVVTLVTTEGVIRWTNRTQW